MQSLAKHILHALRFLEEQGIIHADLKPSNILVTSLDDFPKVKLIDFGLSRHTESMPIWGGTLAYRAPETIIGIECTPALDMWAFGCIIMQIYTGCTFPQNTEEDKSEKHLAAIM